MRSRDLANSVQAGPTGALRSDTLGLSLRPDGERVRLRNLATGADYAWASENFVLLAANERKAAAAEERAQRATLERRAAEERAAAEEKRAAALAARIARLQALVAAAGIDLPEG